MLSFSYYRKRPCSGPYKGPEAVLQLMTMKQPLIAWFHLRNMVRLFQPAVRAAQRSCKGTEGPVTDCEAVHSQSRTSHFQIWYVRVCPSVPALTGTRGPVIDREAVSLIKGSDAAHTRHQWAYQESLLFIPSVEWASIASLLNSACSYRVEISHGVTVSPLSSAGAFNILMMIISLILN